MTAPAGRGIERSAHLWVPILAPVVWAANFSFSYVVVALACGRFTALTSIASPRVAVGVSSGAAMIAISALFLRGFRAHRYRFPDRPNDDDTPEDRTRFAAFTTMLLAGLSFVATAYGWFAIASVSPCR